MRELFDAVRAGDGTEVLRLLEGGYASTFDREPDGSTALHVAVRERQLGVLRVLLDDGALVDTMDHHGDTALMVAVASDAPEIVLELLEAGAEVEYTNRDGESAIAIAARLGRGETVALLERYRPIPPPPPPPPDPALAPRGPVPDFTALLAGAERADDILGVPSRLVACDPYLIRSAAPFRQRLPVGWRSYQVFVALGDDLRPRAAAIQTAGTVEPDLSRIVRWELAVREDQDPASLTDDREAGFPVDYATACFTSAEVAAYLAGNELAYEELCRAMELPMPFAVYRTPYGEVFGFTSGRGDGRYPCYVGYDDEEQPLVVAVAF